MKAVLSNSGELHVSQNSRAILIFAIIFIVILVFADGIEVLTSLQPELAPTPDAFAKGILWIGNPALIGFAVWAIWFVPIRRELVVSDKALTIVDLFVFKFRAASYSLADVDHIDYSYFEQYRGPTGALITMHLRTGKEVCLMKLASTSQCTVATTALKSYFVSRDRQELVYELSNSC